MTLSARRSSASVGSHERRFRNFRTGSAVGPSCLDLNRAWGRPGVCLSRWTRC